MKPFDVINLGSGKGYSVMEVVDTYGRVAGKEVKYVIG
jgi:UDP-glucose 4-epimerase